MRVNPQNEDEMMRMRMRMRMRMITHLHFFLLQTEDTIPKKDIFESHLQVSIHIYTYINKHIFSPHTHSYIHKNTKYNRKNVHFQSLIATTQYSQLEIDPVLSYYDSSCLCSCISLQKTIVARIEEILDFQIPFPIEYTQFIFSELEKETTYKTCI